ncbi:MAG: DUF4125 family protein [Lachnospiraceae bacterium]|nr:DUF4125 family protein [Lachnospiraceae bacterium]
MDINKILIQYDGMFGSYDLGDIEEFLVDNIEMAKDEGDTSSQFTLLNEMIGFCRDTTQQDKGIMYCQQLTTLMGDMGIAGTFEYATAQLNIANAYRAFGRSDESMECYKETLEIYNAMLDDNDFGYANLYNNWALLYQEMGDFESARDCLYKALRVVDSYQEAEVQQAITRTNLGSSLVAIGTKESCDEAEKLLLRALAIFERDGGKDFHYNATLVAIGDLMCKKKCYVEAVDFYERGLGELEKHVGRNENYDRVKKKLDYAIKKYEDRETESMLRKSMAVEEKECLDIEEDSVVEVDDSSAWKNNMDRSRAFYENYGKKMIHDSFPEYEDKIAVGVVGMGSDCFGFDDEISTDHDYDIGFCMWLTPEVYDEIGEQLIMAYKDLLKKVGVDEDDYGRLIERRGVFEIRDFYREFLGEGYNLGGAIFGYEDYQLAAATNGEVFRDDLGEFTEVRNRLLEYYNDRAWGLKLVKAVHNFSQYGQSNYARMMARKDYVTANICIGKAVESAMDLTYLLARSYAPYYKWKFKGLEKLINERKWINIDKLFELRGLLVELSDLPGQAKAWEGVKYDPSVVNYNDKKLVLIDKIAEALLSELKSKDLATGDELFLQCHEPYITRHLRNSKVKQIIEMEWEMFDKVKNEGGRADCQDDWNTFSIMRKSQYMAWTRELQESYLTDLEIASSKGWNMIMEKYARMMESTCPAKYDELKKDLPRLTEDRIAIQESIIAIQVEWMESFAAQYPKMAGNSRSIRTHTDNEYNTSYETYLRGEISTYSERTFVLYGKFIANLHRQGKNLAYMIMNNTARLYGYMDVDDAESRL